MNSERDYEQAFGPAPLQLNLLNGARTKDAWNPQSPDFIDDWKPESRTIPIWWMSGTYMTTLRIAVAGPDDDATELEFDVDWIVFDGVYYGDFSIESRNAERAC